MFKKEKEIKKGIAFPTCLSVNNCICHFSPTKNDPDYQLKEGDVVKIDLGAHIDGFIAVAAHTVVARSDVAAKVTGSAADVILATYWASQAALRLLKPGTGVSFDLLTVGFIFLNSNLNILFHNKRINNTHFHLSHCSQHRTMQLLMLFKKLPANLNVSQSKVC